MKVILVDAMNLVKRQQHTHAELASSEGDETGILHGVLSNILFFNKMFPDHGMVFAFEGGRTWRHELSKEYKANREEHDLDEQLTRLKEVFDIFGIKHVTMPGYEADDVIGFLSWAFEDQSHVQEILIYSSDKDFFQLITPRTLVIRRDKSVPEGYSKIGIQDVLNQHGVHPKDWAKMRAFCGDSSDNLKPVPGVGGKTAVKLLNMGIDPSKPGFSQRTAIIAGQLRPHWNKIHECYLLSRILRSPEEERVPKENKAGIQKIIDGIVANPYREKFSEKQMDQRTEDFIQFARKYELIYLLSHRHTFWRIP